LAREHAASEIEKCAVEREPLSKSQIFEAVEKAPLQHAASVAIWKSGERLGDPSGVANVLG
jgi:hypothetical protein